MSKFDVKFEIEKALNNINFTKILVCMNLLGWKYTGQETTENTLKETCARIMKASYSMAERRDVQGEWAFASSGGFTSWCFIETETGNPKFHVSFDLEQWDNLD